MKTRKKEVSQRKVSLAGQRKEAKENETFFENFEDPTGKKSSAGASTVGDGYNALTGIYT